MYGNVWVTMVWYESLEKLDWYGDYLAPEKTWGLGNERDEPLELDDKLLMFEQRHHRDLNGKEVLKRTTRNVYIYIRMYIYNYIMRIGAK